MCYYYFVFPVVVIYVLKPVPKFHIFLIPCDVYEFISIIIFVQFIMTCEKMS